MSTRVKQRAVIEFLTAENVIPNEIHRRLKAVYGDDAVDRSTVNRWVIKFHGCEPGKAVIDDKKRSRRQITATDDEHRKLIDDLIQNDRRITQKRIANHICWVRGSLAPIILQHDNARPHSCLLYTSRCV